MGYLSTSKTNPTQNGKTDIIPKVEKPPFNPALSPSYGINQNNESCAKVQTANKADVSNATQTLSNHAVENNELTSIDRVKNTIIGASMGLAVGGAALATIGAGATVWLASATTHITLLFGATGAQTFALGALAYDVTAIFVAPFLSLSMEPIEINP